MRALLIVWLVGAPLESFLGYAEPFEATAVLPLVSICSPENTWSDRAIYAPSVVECYAI